MKSIRRYMTWRASAIGLCLMATITLAAAGFGPGGAFGLGAEKQLTPDPHQDLPTDARATAYARHFNEFMARRAQWIQDFQASGKDASKLPRAPMLASYPPAQPSLTVALQNADLVVEGTVVNVVYTPTGTVGTVRIAVAHKASSRAASHLRTTQPTEIQVILGYSPEPPSQTYPAGVLAVPENQPVLLRGARAHLLLELDEVQGKPAFFIQSYTVGYEIDGGGKIAPMSGNPFADQVRGRTPEQFATLITGELRK